MLSGLLSLVPRVTETDRAMPIAGDLMLSGLLSLVPRDTDTDRAMPIVACISVPKRSFDCCDDVRRVWDRVRTSLGLLTTAISSCIVGGCDDALVGSDRSAAALEAALMTDCLRMISHTGSSSSMSGFLSLVGSLRVSTMLSSSVSESKLRSEMGLDVVDREGVSGKSISGVLFNGGWPDTRVFCGKVD